MRAGAIITDLSSIPPGLLWGYGLILLTLAGLLTRFYLRIVNGDLIPKAQHDREVKALVDRLADKDRIIEKETAARREAEDVSREAMRQTGEMSAALGRLADGQELQLGIVKALRDNATPPEKDES